MWNGFCVYTNFHCDDLMCRHVCQQSPSSFQFLSINTSTLLFSSNACFFSQMFFWVTHSVCLLVLSHSFIFLLSTCILLPTVMSFTVPMGWNFNRYLWKILWLSIILIGLVIKKSHDHTSEETMYTREIEIVWEKSRSIQHPTTHFSAFRNEFVSACVRSSVITSGK